MITLKITKSRNKTEEEAKAEYLKQSYNEFNRLSIEDYMKETVDTNTLNVEITEEQFEAIRKEVLKTF